MFLTTSINAEEGKFFLLLGPSGSGKSTIIEYLKEMDARFIYVSPYTTRTLREGETDKIHVSLEQIKQMQIENKLLTVNNIYGIYYATPKDVIDNALSSGLFPILDWPADKMDIMLNYYSDHLKIIYIEPENLQELERRLATDGRDKDGQRFAKGKEELENYASGIYDNFIDLKIVNTEGEAQKQATTIYKYFVN
jgi:guanylate kinase